jgi:hypothetical protein
VRTQRARRRGAAGRLGLLPDAERFPSAREMFQALDHMRTLFGQWLAELAVGRSERAEWLDQDGNVTTTAIRDRRIRSVAVRLGCLKVLENELLVSCLGQARRLADQARAGGLRPPWRRLWRRRAERRAAGWGRLVVPSDDGGETNP